MDETKKCSWCQDHGIMEMYHDEEWGVPCHDDHRLYEYLLMEAMSCGLSWKLMLQKREIFRECFADFDYDKVANFGEADIDRILEVPGMIRSRRKVEAMIGNARCFSTVRQEFGSFDNYIWQATHGKTIVYQRHLDGEWMTKSRLSDNIAKDLKKRGFKYLGSTLIYSYLQGIGVVNDHEQDCWKNPMHGSCDGDGWYVVNE